MPGTGMPTLAESVYNEGDPQKRETFPQEEPMGFIKKIEGSFKKFATKIEVETKTLNEVREALIAKADIIMLDLSLIHISEPTRPY